jgi:hypothetical protein
MSEVPDVIGWKWRLAGGIGFSLRMCFQVQKAVAKQFGPVLFCDFCAHCVGPTQQ